MSDKTFDASTMAVLRPPVDDNSEALEMMEREIATVEEVVEPVVPVAETKVFVQDKLKKLDPEDKAINTVHNALTTWFTSYRNQAKQVKALRTISEQVMKYPNKKMLDAMLVFFKENKDSDMFSATKMFQHLEQLPSTAHDRVQWLFTIMRLIATNKATRKNLSLSEVRRVFGSESIINWVAPKLKIK